MTSKLNLPESDRQGLFEHVHSLWILCVHMYVAYYIICIFQQSARVLACPSFVYAFECQFCLLINNSQKNACLASTICCLSQYTIFSLHGGESWQASCLASSFPACNSHSLVTQMTAPDQFYQNTGIWSSLPKCNVVKMGTAVIPLQANIFCRYDFESQVMFVEHISYNYSRL